MSKEKYIEVGGRLHSIATGNVALGANELFDDDKNKKQSDINAETDAALENRYTKEQTYNKSELNNMITTPNQKYVTVTATEQTTDVTEVLPAIGEADTLYRIGNWDSNQYTPSLYSEYAWNGSQYIHLSTKTQIGEVFDISAYHATGGTLATYADLSAALDSNNGGGVPQSLQKGGMSIKFVQSSDNKYVQYMYVGTSTDIADFTNIANWEKVNIETDVQKEIGYEIIKAIVPGKYITTNTGVGNQIGEEVSVARFNYMRFYVQEGDIVIVNGTGGGAPRLWAFIDEDEIILSVANANISASNLKIVAPENSKECIINTEDISVPSVYISKSSINGRVAKLSNDAKGSMLHSKDWIVSGNVVYDNNEIPVSYDIVWADGTVGTVVNSNFDSDVYEYSTITATYGSDTVVYSLTFDDNGYIINETINIQ